jgi:hypothetical protein
MLYQDQMLQDSPGQVARLKLLAQCVTAATIALGVVAVFLPDYNHLAATSLIALPWIAVWLVARYQPLYRFGGKSNEGHPDLTAVLMLPGLMLAWHSLREAHTFDSSGPLMLAFMGGLALSAAALRVDPWLRQQPLTAFFLCLFMFAYGYGAGMEIDVLADPTKPNIYPTQVLGKRVSYGSKTNTYYLSVEPWGPITEAAEISVSGARYGATSTGGTVCVYVGKGALRVRWYRVEDCPKN